MTPHVPSDVPPLAGLCTFDEAMRPGLSVDECVRRLKRLHYAFRRLHGIFNARITAEPLYELKSAFSHHAYLCAEHVSALRGRVGEMREPPLGLEEVPHPALGQLFDEILAAPSTDTLMTGLYGCALPAIARALDGYDAETHPLADAPSRRVCRFARLEVGDMLAFGARALHAMPMDDGGSSAISGQRSGVSGQGSAISDQGSAVTEQGSGVSKRDAWIASLEACLSAAGGLDGVSESATAAPPRRYSAAPYVYDKVPRRDVRFSDPYNMAVNAEAFIWDASKPAPPKLLMLFYKRLREIDVPEMMASIIAETPGKPWAYYHDMSRQLWDEARHALMGEVGFAALGIDWPSLVRINFTWSLGLNTQLTPIERHAVLYFIEQGLMARTGKRYEWEVARETGLPLAHTFQDFDWADEVLHARIGRQWYVSDMPSHVEALRYGDRCWSKVLVDWEQWRRDGLTAHENWWPALYRAFCASRSEAPDPEVEAFQVSYQASRADLKPVAE